MSPLHPGADCCSVTGGAEAGGPRPPALHVVCVRMQRDASRSRKLWTVAQHELKAHDVIMELVTHGRTGGGGVRKFEEANDGGDKRSSVCGRSAGLRWRRRFTAALRHVGISAADYATRSIHLNLHPTDTTSHTGVEPPSPSHTRHGKYVVRVHAVHPPPPGGPLSTACSELRQNPRPT